MTTLAIAVLALVIVVALAVFLMPGKGEAGARYQAKREFMSAPEQKLYQLLKQALPEHHVFAQVAFSQIFLATGGDRRENNSKFGHAKQKVADFVVCAKDFKMLAVVELDDSTHTRDRDEAKDSIVKEAGLRMVRWNVKALPIPAEVQKAILA